MHSLYRIVVGASQYVQSAVKYVSYQWVHLACLHGSFAILICSNNTCKPVTVHVGTKYI